MFISWKTIKKKQKTRCNKTRKTATIHVNSFWLATWWHHMFIWAAYVYVCMYVWCPYLYFALTLASNVLLITKRSTKTRLSRIFQSAVGARLQPKQRQNDSLFICFWFSSLLTFTKFFCRSFKLDLHYVRSRLTNHWPESEACRQHCWLTYIYTYF